APRDALLVESVPANQRGAAFGLHRGADNLGGVLGPLIASAILLAFPGRLRLVFGLALIPGLITLLVLWRGVKETPAPRRTAPALAAEPEPAPQQPGSAPSRLGFSFVIYLCVVVVFTLGNASDAFLLLRASDLGVPIAAIP